MANRTLFTRWGIVYSVIVLLFSASSALKASTLTFTGTTGSITLNVSDSDASPSYSGVNAVIDPYTGILDKNAVLLWCVDPDHEVNTYDTWPVYISYAGGNLSQTYLGNANTYGEMAWLITQFQGANTTTQQELQAAIWLIAEGETTQAAEQAGPFTVNGESTAFWNSLYGSNGYITNAPEHVLTSGFEILSDTTGNTSNAKQEFIVMTPEPSTILQLGAGLIALFALAFASKSYKRLAPYWELFETY